MNAKLTKVVAMASLAAFLTVGISANVAQAKDYRYKVDANPYTVPKDDGTVDSSAHPWFKPEQKKHKKHKLSKRERHDKNATAKRSYEHTRANSTNG